MAGLTTLIRLKKHALDEQRRRIGELENQLDSLQNQDRRLADELKAEQAEASARGEPSYTLSAYTERVRQKRVLLSDNIKKLATAIAAARDEMQELFKELKTVEITHENRLKAAAKIAIKKENDTMDEIGLQQFVRRDKE